MNLNTKFLLQAFDEYKYGNLDLMYLSIFLDKYGFENGLNNERFIVFEVQDDVEPCIIKAINIKEDFEYVKFHCLTKEKLQDAIKCGKERVYSMQENYPQTKFQSISSYFEQK